MPILHITAAAAHELASAHDRALPLETCGLILGESRPGEIHGTKIAVARVRCHRDAFEIPDHELRRIRGYAEQRRLQIVALFHSHPSGDGTLSAGDLAALRYSEWPWVIVSRPNGASYFVFNAYTPGDGTAMIATTEISFRPEALTG
jgi:proteasome lid subunit RPN8/RPN11